MYDPTLFQTFPERGKADFNHNRLKPLEIIYRIISYSGAAMKIEEIQKLTEAELICGEPGSKEIFNAFSSDLMSDVLTNEADEAVLITGLANVQAIRTAEMADISCILFVRDKEIPANMVRLAEENDIILMKSRHTMFWVCGVLYQNGMVPVY
jgi:predicted transcriptional regulator